MAEIVMPRLSDTMTEGTVIRWLRGPGDSVRRGEPIVEIETDKATITYEADLDGTIEQILVGEGQTVPVGTTIATIAQSGAGAAPGPAPLPTPEAAPAPLPMPEGMPAPLPTPEGEPAPLPAPEGAPPPLPTPGVVPEPMPPAVAVEPGPMAPAEPQLTRPSQQMPPAGEPAAPAPPAEPPVPEPTQAEVEGRVKASPIARRLARKLGVDLASVAGTGPGGRVVKEDVEAAASAQAGGLAEPAPEPRFAPESPPPEPQPLEPPASPPVAPAQPEPPAPPPQPPAGVPEPPPAMGAPGVPTAPQPGATGGFMAVTPPMAAPQQPGAPATGATATRGQSTTVPLTQAQQVVARRMAEAKATVPEFQVEVDVDMTAATALREQLRYGAQPAPSINDIVVKGCAMALRQFPRVNGAYKDGRFEYYNDVNVGVVVSAGDLLAVPVVFNADQKGLAQIARESHELAAAVRGRQIQPAQLAGGTFTVSNLGMFGIPRFNAIINPPQAGILAVGAIQRKPVVAEDGFQLQVRPIMTLTLSVDHRIVYGQEAAEFLGAIKSWLENPHALQI